MLEVVYRTARSRVAEVAAALGDQQLRVRVPATPGWVVHEVLAHLVGVAADAAVGRMDGVAGPAWTERHVAERRHRPVHDLLTEWHQVAPVIEAGLVGQRFCGPNAAADLICHEADLCEALGLGRVDRQHWEQPFLEVMMLVLDERLQNIATVTVHDDQGRQWLCGSGTPVSELRADGYELLRGMFSRRSRGQIAAWDWTATPTAQMVDCFGFLGPRDDDQPVPAA
jgi:uncharacterized protein (TIGR03083 family)